MSLEKPPAWVTDAVFYQIFPDRFASSDQWEQPPNLEPWDAPPTHHGYKGGNLLGVIEHLDYLVDLGINALYFNPIFASGSNHRYHAWDYYRIDPLLGDDEVFDQLITACHDRGIRVVLDGVFNHTGRGFFQFSDVVESGQQSPYVDWYHFHSFPVDAFGRTPNYDAWWGMPALPKLNTGTPHVREYLMQVAEYWVTRGIDGWRLDVPQEITTPGFWEEFRERVRAINPEAYIVAEIWEDASNWISSGDQFDGTMNYLFTGYTLAFVAGDSIPRHLTTDLNYPLHPALDGQSFSDAMNNLIGLYPWSATLANLNLLDSHDVPRVLTLCADDPIAVELAVAIQMTFPGAPSIYYGSEVGLTGGRDPENRSGFDWDEDTWNRTTLETHRSLIRLRHDHQALRTGSYRTLPVGPELYVVERADETERILVAVNASYAAHSATVQEAIGTTFTTLYGDGGISSDGTTTRLAVAPRTAVIWRVES
jgi:glycosidase